MSSGPVASRSQAPVATISRGGHAGRRLRSQLFREEGTPVAGSGRNSGRNRVARSPVASVPVATP
eukprot:4122-Alexandrium_andersonii.AAC.1